MKENDSVEWESTRRIRVDESGRLVLPSKFRKRLGWAEGDTLLLGQTPDGMTLRRWEGTEQELDCIETARAIAALVESVSVSDRDFLKRVLAEEFAIGLTTAPASSDVD